MSSATSRRHNPIIIVAPAKSLPVSKLDRSMPSPQHADVNLLHSVRNFHRQRDEYDRATSESERKRCLWNLRSFIDAAINASACTQTGLRAKAEMMRDVFEISGNHCNELVTSLVNDILGTA